MSNIAQPDIFINYISEFKKILVTRQNKPITQMFKIDSNITDDYYFQILNKNNQIVSLAGRSFQIYGSIIDAKSILHVLFFTDSYTIEDNVLHFHINTFTSQYMAMITNTKEANITIVETTGNNIQVVLRDVGLFYKRPYIEGQQIQEINTRYILTGSVPFSGQFGSGQDINLTDYTNGSAFGTSLTQTGDNQMVIGYNNTPDATKAFIIANSGNIFTVDYEGNVEAGDLNVGAISATSITVSGEDLNQVIDDKVEYLSTSVDDKLEATSGWVNETFEPISTAQQNFNTLTGNIDSLSTTADEKFETKAAATESFNTLEQEVSDLSAEAYGAFELKEDATSKFNTLTGQTDYLSSAIDAHTQSIGELNNAVAAKANQTDLEALSGKVEAIHVPSAVSELENDVPYLSAIPTSYVQQSQLDDYALKSEIPVTTGFATKAELSAVDDKFNGYATTETVNGIDARLTAVENAGYITDSTLEPYAKTSAVAETYATKNEISDFITESAITGLATKQEATYTGSGAITVENNVISLTGELGKTYYADETTLQLNDSTNTFSIKSLEGKIEAGNAGIEVNTINGITYISNTGSGGGGGSDKIYSAGVGLSSANVTTSNTQFFVDQDWLSTFVEDATSDIQNLSAGTGLQIVDNVISVSAQYLSAIPEGYATESWVEQNFLSSVPDTFATKDYVTGAISGKASQTDLEALSTQVQGIPVVEKVSDLQQDIPYISSIPTSYVQQSDLEDYAKTSAVAAGYATKAEATYTGTGSVVVENNVISLTGDLGKTYTGASGIIIDSNNVIGISANFLSANALEGYAEQSWVEENFLTGTTEIPTKTSDLENDSDFVTYDQIGSTIEGYGYQTATDVEQTIADTSATIVSGLATESYVDNAIQSTSGSIINGLAKDEDLQYVSGVVSAQAEDITTLKAASGDFSNYYTKSEVYTKAETDSAIETATSGKADKTQLTAYALSADVYNKTEVYTKTEADEKFLVESDLSDYAKTQDIPTGNAQLENTANYITDAALEPYAQTSAVAAVSAIATSNATDIGTLSSDIASVSATTSSNSTSIGTLSSDLGSVSASVGTNTTDIGTISAAVVQNISDIGTISANVSTNTTDIGTLSSNIGSASTDIETLSSNLNSVSATVVSNTTDISATSAIATANQTNIGTLSSDLATVSAATTTNTTNIGTISGDLNSLTTGQVATNTENISTLNTNLGTVSGKVDTNAGNITTLSTDLGTANSNIGTLSTTVGGYTNDIASISAIATGNQTNIATVSGDLNTLATGAVATNTTNISTLSSNVVNNYALKTSVPTSVYQIATAGSGITISEAGEIALIWPVIPSAVSQLINDVGFVTETGGGGTGLEYYGGPGISVVGAEISLTATIPTDNSQIGNGAGYITISDVPALSTVYGLLSGVNVDITQDENGIITLSAGTGGGATYTAGSGIAISNQNVISLTATIPTVPTNVSDFTNDAGYQTASDVSGIVSDMVSGEYDGAASAAVENYITASGVVAGTGLFYDDTDNSLNVNLSAANDSNMIVDVDASGVIWLSSIAQGGGTTYTAGTGINISAQDEISVVQSQLSTSQFTNDAGFITSYINTTYAAGEGLALSGEGLSTFVLTASIPDDAHISAIASGYAGSGDSGPTNKQIVSSGFTYDSSVQIYKNQYTPTDSVVTLGEFTVPAGSLGENEVATFEEWVTASNPVTGFAFNDVILIGELPSAFTDKYYYVFSRRINSNGDQFISFAYECTTDKYGNMPLTFKSTGATTVALSSVGTVSQSLSSSVDGGITWTAYTPGNAISLTDGQTVSFSGTNSFTPSDSNYRKFVTTGDGTLEVMGNIMSLNNFDTQMRNYEFYYLFDECKQIVNASKLKLPTTLTNYCFGRMFRQCSNLTSIPEIPATTLAEGCYYYMFFYCSALTSVPELLAQTPANMCYYGMFCGCTNITSAYIGLTSISGSGVCGEMFNEDTKFERIEVNFTAWGTETITTFAWLANVASTGTFVKPTALPIQRDFSHIPTNWTVVNK